MSYEEEKRSMEHYNEDEEGGMMNELMRGEFLSQEQKELMRQFGTEGITKDPKLAEKFGTETQRIIKEAMKTRDIQNKAHKRRMKEIEDNMELMRSASVHHGVQDFPNLFELNNGWSESINGDQFMVIMRKYDIGHRRRKVASLMKSIMNYADEKRDTLIIRENRNIAWQGILGLVFGMFSFLLCALIGQFSEPNERKSPRFKNTNHVNSTQRRKINNFNSQGPPIVPKHFPSGANNRKQAPVRQKAYGGYVPGKSTF